MVQPNLLGFNTQAAIAKEYGCSSGILGLWSHDGQVAAENSRALFKLAHYLSVVSQFEIRRA